MPRTPSFQAARWDVFQQPDDCLIDTIDGQFPHAAVVPQGANGLCAAGAL